MERSDIERGITKKRSDCCKNKGKGDRIKHCEIKKLSEHLKAPY